MKRSIPFFMFFFLLFFVYPNFAKDYHPAKGYHDYNQLTKIIKGIAAKNKKIARLVSIGKTGEGRDIWALQISGTKGKKPEEKQALLICGNIEGDHVIGSEVAAGVADYLISGYGSNPQITETLDKRTFYIVPRLNPDGAELFFARTLREDSRNRTPRDDDYDWKTDEDPPEDLNGDGMITLMRVKDKEGDWVIDKKDPRLMRKKEKSSPVDSLYKIYPEGIDNDGDELYNEDGRGGFNVDRNFPQNFGYKIKGFHVYPASETETRAIIDFMNRYQQDVKTAPHKNICAVLLFSKFDNLAASPGIESGKPSFQQFKKKGQSEQGMMMFRFGRRSRDKSSSRQPARDPQDKKTLDDDVPLFKFISAKYKEITGIKQAVSPKPVGSMLEWSYFQYGVPTFSANLWSLREAKKEKSDSTKMHKKPSAGKANQSFSKGMMMQRFASRKGQQSNDNAGTDEKWLKWIDKENNGVGFVNWQKFNHKQLGEVEIGGFYPYIRVNPPADQIDSLSKKHAEFALFLASQFAEITLDKPTVEKMSNNLYRVKTKIHNSGNLPYACAAGLKSRNISPIMLQLKFSDDKKMKLFGGSKRIDTRNLAPKAEKKVEWVIISPAGKTVELKLWARNGGGTMIKKVVLK
ncbi:MAG: hypothetical protein GXO74_12210 [Calditrichaeota bacterium]|nr:hypothetical protein [Calditrichota bacterium]